MEQAIGRDGISLDQAKKELEELQKTSMRVCVTCSFELYMKAIIRQLEILEGEMSTNQTSHNIESLKNNIVAAIKRHANKTKGLEKALKPVSDYINELYEKIKTVDEKNRRVVNIDFARYPIDAKGNPHFYVAATDNIVIDIENFSARYSELKDSLTGIFYMLEAERENMEEML